MNPMTYDEFVELFVRLRAAAPASSRGAVSALGPSHAARAAGLGRDGVTVDLGRAWEIVGGSDNPKPAVHYMSKLNETVAGIPEPTLYCDFVGADFHAKRITHIDALNHVAFQGLLFGDVPAASVVTGHGMNMLDVSTIGPIVTRGVLLDMAATTGVDWVEPGTAWTESDLEAAVKHAGVSLESGDAVLLRSGSVARRAALRGSDPDVSAGLHVSAIPWLASQGISVLGADDSSDARPSPVEGVSLPVHALLMVAMGVPLIDNLDLEALSAACAKAGRWEFMLVVAPLNIPGGTGSPVSPIAVL